MSNDVDFDLVLNGEKLIVDDATKDAETEPVVEEENELSDVFDPTAVCDTPRLAMVDDEVCERDFGSFESVTECDWEVLCDEVAVTE
jgi:hypothetical protein